MGRKRLRPEITEERLGGNPLTGTDFKILIRKRKDKYYNEKGEQEIDEVELEMEKYVKLFVNSDKRKVMGLLSGASRGLFLWIMYELESGKDWFWINRDRYMEEMGLSSVNTYKAAIAELVKKKLIALSLIKDVYWINPRWYFCGNRIDKYPDNIMEYEPKNKRGTPVTENLG